MSFGRGAGFWYKDDGNRDPESIYIELQSHSISGFGFTGERYNVHLGRTPREEYRDRDGETYNLVRELNRIPIREPPRMSEATREEIAAAAEVVEELTLGAAVGTLFAFDDFVGSLTDLVLSPFRNYQRSREEKLTDVIECVAGQDEMTVAAAALLNFYRTLPVAFKTTARAVDRSLDSRANPEEIMKAIQYYVQGGLIVPSGSIYTDIGLVPPWLPLPVRKELALHLADKLNLPTEHDGYRTPGIFGGKLTESVIATLDHEVPVGAPYLGDERTMSAPLRRGISCIVTPCREKGIHYIDAAAVGKNGYVDNVVVAFAAKRILPEALSVHRN